MLKIKRTALLAVGLTLFQVLAWAGPRSFQQAQAIAERQAALQGIIMDQQQVSKARKQYLLNGSSSSETATSYYVLTTVLTRDSPSFRVMMNCRRL